MRSAWVPMGGAIVAEVCATLLLKASDGFGRPLVGVLALAGFGLALWLLSAALQRLPISVAYPVWIGVGSVAVTGAGAVLFGEHLGVGALLGIALVAGGVVVLNLEQAGLSSRGAR